MVSSNDRGRARARSATSSDVSLEERWRQWVKALGGLVGLGTVIAALSWIFVPTNQSVSRDHATGGDTVNQTQQAHGSGGPANQGAGAINQGAISGNPGVVINGPVTLSGGVLQQNAARTTGEPVSSFRLEKYVDVRAARVAGATNVAVAVHRGAGPNSAPLEDALHEALSRRGFSVIPFFREPFKREGLVEKLYNGDPELAGRLTLRQHCDSVLLGVLRFSGPAENVDGLYIREAILDIRAIDPGTGQVVNSLVIRQKGGGSTAELSTVNAMIRLEEQVAASLSEWSWI